MNAAPIFATCDPALANSFANNPDILLWCGFPARTERVDASNRIAEPLPLLTKKLALVLMADINARG